MRAAAAVLLAGLALSACRESESVSKLPDVRLPTLAGAPGPSLASCLTPKCLTIVVAPWCGVCHAATPDIARLRRFLKKAGVGTRVVVGLADLEPIKRMAALFGPDTLLDPDGVVIARGVPMFIVTAQGGAVVGRVAGFPRNANTPAELAAILGLP